MRIDNATCGTAPAVKPDEKVTPPGGSVSGVTNAGGNGAPSTVQPSESSNATKFTDMANRFVCGRNMNPANMLKAATRDTAMANNFGCGTRMNPADILKVAREKEQAAVTALKERVGKGIKDFKSKLLDFCVTAIERKVSSADAKRQILEMASTALADLKKERDALVEDVGFEGSEALAKGFSTVSRELNDAVRVAQCRYDNLLFDEQLAGVVASEATKAQGNGVHGANGATNAPTHLPDLQEVPTLSFTRQDLPAQKAMFENILLAEINKLFTDGKPCMTFFQVQNAVAAISDNMLEAFDITCAAGLAPADPKVIAEARESFAKVIREKQFAAQALRQSHFNRLVKSMAAVSE